MMHEARIGHTLRSLIERKAPLVAGMLHKHEHGDDPPRTSRLMVDAGMHIAIRARPSLYTTRSQHDIAPTIATGIALPRFACRVLCPVGPCPQVGQDAVHDRPGHV